MFLAFVCCFVLWAFWGVLFVVVFCVVLVFSFVRVFICCYVFSVRSLVSCVLRGSFVFSAFFFCVAGCRGFLGDVIGFCCFCLLSWFLGLFLFSMSIIVCSGLSGLF